MLNGLREYNTHDRVQKQGENNKKLGGKRDSGNYTSLIEREVLNALMTF